MEKVSGIGGFFFRAKDPEALSKWYESHLGINPVPKSHEQNPWQQERGETVFAPFEQSTSYFGDPAKQWMINFRVKNLNKIVEQLKAAGIEVELSAEESPIGKFARLSDPEGNPIELWEP